MAKKPKRMFARTSDNLIALNKAIIERHGRETAQVWMAPVIEKFLHITKLWDELGENIKAVQAFLKVLDRQERKRAARQRKKR